MGWLVEIHSIWRYVVLVTAIAAIVPAALAATGARPWDRMSDRLGFLFTLSMDIQVLIGLLVWVLVPRNFSDTFSTFVHPVLMLGAVGLAHVGRARSERAQGERAQGRQALVFFGASIAVVLLAIPLSSWPV